VARLPWFGRISGAFLLLAALLFLLHALQRLAPLLGRGLVRLERAPAAWSRAVARITARVDRTRPYGGYALGMALGLLPCGFLYAALAAAGASATPLLGAVAMLAFGMGTVPALVAVGIAGQAAGHRWRHAAAATAPAVMLLNTALLGALALRSLLMTT
jgi:sulfite exporter TauE/SafE